MENLGNRISYLKGLAEGLGVSASTNEGRLIAGIIDLLKEMSDSIEDLQKSQAELSEYTEMLDKDVADLEDAFYEEEDDDEECECCGHYHDDDEDCYDEEEEDSEDDDDTQYIEVECPNCHETVYFDEEVFDDAEDVTCPSCDKSVIVDDDDSEKPTK